MYKKITTLLIALVGTAVSAQNPLPVGGVDLNAGVGFSNWGVPVYIGLDYGVHKDITIGAEFSYRSYREHWRGNKHYPPAYYRHQVWGFLANGNYHFNSLLEIPKQWDLYAGLNIGFIQINSPDYYYGGYRSGLGLGAQIGGRYYFNDKFGLNLELGGGNTLSGGKFGITVKF